MSLLAEPLTAAVSRDVRDYTLLHRLGCKICPLANVEGNKHPDMAPTGAKKPLVYILGEAPGRHEDSQGRQFVGDSGQLLRTQIPDHLKKRIRFNNVVRTRPYRSNTPERTAIECCRPSVVADIEAARPKAIFGFGNIPLEWATGMSGVTLWRGRRLPVRIGSHTCWFYPMVHPAWLVQKKSGDYSRIYQDDPLQVSSEDERMFVLDLRRAFAELESLPEPQVHTAADARVNVEIVTDTTVRGLRRVLDHLRWAAEQPGVGYDYETTGGLRPYAKGTRILSIAVGNDEYSLAFPWDHREAPWSGSAQEDLREAVLDFLEVPVVKRYVHNLAYEHEWTAVKFGPEFLRAGEWVDTATQACILDERTGKKKPGPLSLEWLVLQHFGLNLKALSGLDRANLEDAPLEAELLYNGMDAKYHFLLGEAQAQRIADEGLEEAYRLGYRRIPTVVLSQYKGLPVDQKEVRRLKAKYTERLQRLEREISELDVVEAYRRRFHQKFNPHSPEQVVKLLREVMDARECRVWDKKSREYKFSSKEEVLEKIDHPFTKLLVALRKAQRRKSTYIDPLEVGSPILYPDGLLHTQLNAIFAETGRLSAESPNVQNFPKREEEASEVRKPIRAAPGELILSIDYGQIEARVIAMFTQDPAFVKALWERYDVHMEWAERIAYAYPRRIGGRDMLCGFELLKDPRNKDRPEVKAAKDLRTDIKNQWTFPLFFGATVRSASGFLKIPEDVLQPLYDDFWDQFSGVRDWQARQLRFYQENGYVECLTGRRRRGPLSLNQVLNTPVQGTAAEIVMDSMCRLSEIEDLNFQPELNIHDDLTFVRIPEARFDEMVARILDEMLDVPFPWARTVPITVELSCGKNWLDMKEIGDVSSDEWFPEERA